MMMTSSSPSSTTKLPSISPSTKRERNTTTSNNRTANDPERQALLKRAIHEYSPRSAASSSSLASSPDHQQHDLSDINGVTPQYGDTKFTRIFQVPPSPSSSSASPSPHHHNNNSNYRHSTGQGAYLPMYSHGSDPFQLLHQHHHQLHPGSYEEILQLQREYNRQHSGRCNLTLNFEARKRQERQHKQAIKKLGVLRNEYLIQRAKEEMKKFPKLGATTTSQEKEEQEQEQVTHDKEKEQTTVAEKPPLSAMSPNNDDPSVEPKSDADEREKQEDDKNQEQQQQQQQATTKLRNSPPSSVLDDHHFGNTSSHAKPKQKQQQHHQHHFRPPSSRELIDLSHPPPSTKSQRKNSKNINSSSTSTSATTTRRSNDKDERLRKAHEDKAIRVATHQMESLRTWVTRSAARMKKNNDGLSRLHTITTKMTTTDAKNGNGIVQIEEPAIVSIVEFERKVETPRRQLNLKEQRKKPLNIVEGNGDEVDDVIRQLMQDEATSRKERDRLLQEERERRAEEAIKKRLEMQKAKMEAEREEEERLMMTNSGF